MTGNAVSPMRNLFDGRRNSHNAICESRRRTHFMHDFMYTPQHASAHETRDIVRPRHKYFAAHAVACGMPTAHVLLRRWHTGSGSEMSEGQACGERGMHADAGQFLR
jgi:hypothetical protein